MTAKVPIRGLMGTAASICATVAAVLALAGVAAWSLHRWHALTFGKGFVPMAPSTALLMLALSAAAFLQARAPASRLNRMVGLVLASGTLLGGLVLGLQFVSGFSLPLESWLAPTEEKAGQIAVGRMSPLTAACFMAAALGLLCRRVGAVRWQPLRSLSGWLGLAVLCVSGIIVAGYLAGTPFLYGGSTIPMALLTALAFGLVSVAALLDAGSDAWPLSMFLRERASAEPGQGHRIEWSLLLLFLLLVAGIALVGVQYLNHEQAVARLAAHAQLDAFANLKVGQVTQWRNERLADAKLIQGTPYGTRRALDVLAQPGSSRTRQMYTGWLEPYLTGGRFERAILLDADLSVRLVHPEDASRELGEGVRQSVAQALRSREVSVADLHRTSDSSHVHLDFLIPLVVRREGTNDNVPAAGLEPSLADRSAGLLILQVNAHDFLFPLIQTWPTASPTAETLLVRREGDEVLFLNELRHREGSALTLRRPLNDPQLPAAMGLRGELSVREGVDYRGVPVVATAGSVPDTAWFMVAKVDQAELYAPLRQKALAAGGLALALLLVAALGVTVLWRRRNEQFLRTQLATEHDCRVSAERFEHLMRHANDAVLLTDAHCRILEANERALQTYGWTLEELQRKTLPDLRAPETRAAFAGQFETLCQEHRVLFETVHQRKDGTTFPIEVSASLVEIGGVSFKLAMVRDITQRRLHEAEIGRLNRLYATLSQVNQTIVRCQTREELFADICRVAVEFGQFMLAWIGWKAAGNGALTTVAHQASGPDLRLTMPGWTRGCGVMAEAVRTGQPYLCNDSHTDERAACCRETLAGLGVQSCAAFPLQLGGEVCGVFSICSIEPTFFNADEIRLLEEVTSDISFALDKLDKEAQRQQAESKLALQARIASIFLTVPDDEMFNEVLKVILDVLHSPFGVFGYLDEAGALVVPTMTRQIWDKCQVPERTIRFPRETWGDSSWPRAIREERVVCSNVPSEHIPEGHVSIHRHISLPVLFHGEPIGLFQVANSTSDYTTEDIRQLEFIAQHVAPLLSARLGRERAEAALQASEVRYRRLFESAKDGILILDAETGIIVDANPFLIELLGFCHEGLLGKKVWGLGFFKDILANQAHFSELQRKGYARYEDVPLETADGRRIEVEFVSNVYQVDHHRVIQCNIRDITERKRLERERAAMEAPLRQQQKLESIGTLASGVAHEINNPINGIMNYAQLIQDRLPVRSPLGEYTGEILHETERIAGIVRNLLTFSQSGKQSHSPARMVDIVEGTLSLIRTVIRQDQITLTVNVAADLPDVRCRSQQIQQVLMNLMTNARDALNERHPGYDPDKVMRVEASLSEKAGRRWIRVTVEDHGTGITSEVRERMFDPFFTTKPRDKGTGLGLSISHGIVKEHHGGLTVETEPGKFTRIHLDLPVDNGWDS